MKKFLFLDDSQERHNMFLEILRSTGKPCWTSSCHTVDEAIHDLKEYSPFDCVYLDHDLDDTDPHKTGMAVAEFIALHLDRDLLPKKVIIHSHNPDGATRMAKIIRESGIPVEKIPFIIN